MHLALCNIFCYVSQTQLLAALILVSLRIGKRGAQDLKPNLNNIRLVELLSRQANTVEGKTDTANKSTDQKKT